MLQYLLPTFMQFTNTRPQTNNHSEKSLIFPSLDRNFLIWIWHHLALDAHVGRSLLYFVGPFDLIV